MDLEQDFIGDPDTAKADPGGRTTLVASAFLALLLLLMCLASMCG